jgi:DNA-binding transcriptional regulator YdaS (Cro superfamily)
MEDINITHLAKKLGITRTYLSSILNFNVECGAKRARQIEVLTNGVIQAATLRPDVFGDPFMVQVSKRRADRRKANGRRKDNHVGS